MQSSASPQSMGQVRRDGGKESALRSALTRVDPGLYVIGTPTHRGAWACVQAYGAGEVRVRLIATLLELRIDSGTRNAKNFGNFTNAQ
jgi:hypothetical protein